MRRGHQIDVVYPGGTQSFHDLPQTGGIHRRSGLPVAADGGILTKHTSQIASGKKDRAGPVLSAQAGLFPYVRRRPGHIGGLGTAANA